MCCTIGMSGDYRSGGGLYAEMYRSGGGLYAEIFSSRGVSSSSMSWTAVMVTNNIAGTMRWALLSQHGLWVVPLVSEWLCVCVREGGLSVVCEQYCVSRQHC